MPPTHVPHTHVCSRLRGHGRAACFTLSARLVDGAGAGRCRMPRGRVRSGLSRSTGWARLGSPVDGGGRVRNPRRPSSRGSRGPAPAQPNPNHPAPIMLPRLDALDGRQGPDADQGPNARQLGDGVGSGLPLGRVARAAPNGLEETRTGPFLKGKIGPPDWTKSRTFTLRFVLSL